MYLNISKSIPLYEAIRAKVSLIKGVTLFIYKNLLIQFFLNISLNYYFQLHNISTLNYY